MKTFIIHHATGDAKFSEVANQERVVVGVLQAEDLDDAYNCSFIDESDIQKQNRIAYLLVVQLDRIPKMGHIGTLPDFYEKIKEYNCWQYGYVTKTNLFGNKDVVANLSDYDYNEAVARYCLSFFCNLEREQWNVIAPNKDVLPLNNNIKQVSIKKMFNNEQ